MTTPPTTHQTTRAGIGEVIDDRYRPELLAHCYRMLGSVHDAEDLVQETYVRAWRAFDGFQGRSSVRTWLYRIATNACLTALESRGRRPLPSGLGGDPSDPRADLVQRPEVPWLEPVPDALVSGVTVDTADDPARIVTERETVRLAFVSALQNLPPRQRAVLLLRDVLAWHANEVAEAVGISTAAANSLLQRARATMQDLDPDQRRRPDPLTPDQEDLLARYVDAFERYDIAGLVDLFTADAVWEMPPYTGWYRSGADIAALISTQCPANAPDDMRMVATSANGQPAFALYMLGPDGVHRRFHIQVLTLTGAQVSHVVAFFDTELFETFGLPEVWPG